MKLSGVPAVPSTGCRAELSLPHAAACVGRDCSHEQELVTAVRVGRVRLCGCQKYRRGPAGVQMSWVTVSLH